MRETGDYREHRRTGATIVMLALTLLSWSSAQAATCLASADEVRKVEPKAWPKWTYGPAGERCWYYGKKPVFAKTPNSQDAMPQAAVSQPETTSGEASRIAEPVTQPWALEYRWSDRFEIHSE